MSLFDNLSDSDRKLIDNYIEEYAYTDNDDTSTRRASLEYLLRYWSKNKESLYEMMGHQFILERPISIKKSSQEIARTLTEGIGQPGNPYWDFREEMYALKAFHNNDDNWYEQFTKILHRVVDDVDVFANNLYQGIRIDLPLPDGKTLTFDDECKPMRLLGKLAKVYNLKTFEAFRIWHSQQLNQKSLQGNLCLSIHPLDFMTMSDNNSNWSSCMSWMNEGCYRSGTVECMNSPYVVVAYLKSLTEDMVMPFGTWNNKKWRSLFIVHDKLITSVKGYPYRSDELTKAALKWLLELVPNKERYGKIIKYDYIGRGIEPLDAPQGELIYNLEIVTEGHMYNDFGSTVHIGAFVEDEIPPYSKSWSDYVLTINYSGPAVCMHCGEVDDMPDEEVELLCRDCSYVTTCGCCDCCICGDDSFMIDGITLCEDCYEDHTLIDPITGERHYEYDMGPLYLVPDDCEDSDINDVDLKYFESIRVLQTTCQHDNMHKVFPKYFATESSLHTTVRWWSTRYYVHPSELTEAGLRLFEEQLDKHETLEDYYGAIRFILSNRKAN